MQLIILLLNIRRIENYLTSYNIRFPVVSTNAKASKFSNASEADTRAKVAMNQSDSELTKALTMSAY